MIANGGSCRKIKVEGSDKDDKALARTGYFEPQGPGLQAPGPQRSVLDLNYSLRFRSVVMVVYFFEHC